MGLTRGAPRTGCATPYLHRLAPCPRGHVAPSLRRAAFGGRKVRRPNLTVATVDHNTPTWELSRPVDDAISKRQLDALADNVKGTGIAFYDRYSPNQGIVHVIGPDLGYTQPGMTVVCGDSHTSTHGALGCFALGIGTTEVEHVLATQTLQQFKPKTMEVRRERPSARRSRGQGRDPGHHRQDWH